ncbi:beta-lactamase-like protein [Apodospora peruviana]|uniref:Beta-lactamase-like protein n=1 Tax=Apodospora peruviana TaxID=516989 RepID=A0AAE0HZH1_9PEZI|nr:beta-lactamase-like protein [Apodospora peruviana]
MTTNNRQAIPDLHIPPSNNTVQVSIINTTSTIRGAKTADFFGPPIRGHDWLAAPAFSFLIQHQSNKDGTRNLLFDLGIRKDWWNLSPALLSHIKPEGWVLDVKKSVHEILKETSFDISTIEAIIWSHHHFDHAGDMSTFGPNTALVVGPDFTKHLLPGYPASQNSFLLESDYSGRELVELDFNQSRKWKASQIGQVPAIDYFGDGSFYLLDTPGHAIGHICGLARVTAGGSDGDEDSFILMAGDAFHHAGEIRPSSLMPLPREAAPFEALLPGKPQMGPFYAAAGSTLCCSSGNGQGAARWHYDADEAVRTIGKLQEFDAQENILVVAAHDESLLNVVEFFPATAHGFVKQGWVKKARWRFLWDFVGAVACDEGEVMKLNVGGLEGERGTGVLREEPNIHNEYIIDSE